MDRFSGSAGIHVELPLPEGRNGLSPKLGLAFGSASSRGVFGMGWSMTGLAAIGVDGDGGLPSYDGSGGYSATFGGRLVPVRDAAGTEHVRVVGGFRVHRFRAASDEGRIRFEKWVEQATGRVHWRSRDTANTLTIYGRDAAGLSRIADPADPARTYQWLPDVIINATGDAISFVYAAEDRAGGAGALSSEAGRTRPEPQRYLKRISWANADPADPSNPDTFDPTATDWAFHAVLDYGDHDPVAPQFAPDRSWPARPDPYSVATPGFDVRSWRLCRRLLVFHRFAALGPAPVLASSFAFDFDLRPEGARLTGITRTGHRDGVSKSVPPLRFEYSQPSVGNSFRAVPRTLAEAAPAGLTTSRTHLVDLYGEGLPGILYDDPAGWSFRRNLGGGEFAPPRLVNARPAHSLTSAALGDFDGDGNMDAIILSGSGAGHYRFDRQRGEWGPFRPFQSAPKIGVSGQLQRLDLTGDGRADLVVRDGAALTWHKAIGSDGYAPEATRVRHDEAVMSGPGGAPPLATDPATDYMFADMTGDGMPDQVLVRPGLVVYWRNLGHGRFGPPCVMAGAPELGGRGRFATNRVLLADLDGSGTADLLWLGEGEIRVWTNASGNAFVNPRVFGGLPMIDTTGVLDVIDILGDGGRHLVWSTNAAQGCAPALQMLQLSDPLPPGLVVAVDNSMGGREEIVYGHSLMHYRRDQGTDRQWMAPMPGHFTVVDRLRHRDLVLGTEIVTEFRYRNGTFDSRRRHFTGFGEVDAIDAPFQQGAADPEPASAPSLTRTFFDAGAETGIATRFWQGDPDAVAPPTFSIELGAGVAGVDGETYDEARARLTGREIRTEVFAFGPDAPEPVPLSVETWGYKVTLLQQPMRRGRAGLPPPNDRAAFVVTENEAVNAIHEGVADDPRISHSFALETDAAGAVVLSADVVYPRRAHIPAADPQQQVLHTMVKRLTRRHDDTDDMLALNQPIEDEEFTIDALAAPARGWFTLPEMAARVAVALAAPLTHDQAPVPGRARRTAWHRHFYWNTPGTAALPLGQTAQPLRLHHAESAVASAGFMQGQYGVSIDARLPGLGYSLDDGHWWQSGTATLYHDAAGFYRGAGSRLRDGSRTEIRYDALFLFGVESRDQAGASTRMEIDYYALAPRRQVGPTGYWEERLFDPLGVGVLSAHGGHVAVQGGGQAPYGFAPLGAGAVGPTVAEMLADPMAALGGAASAVAYDLDAWTRDGTPVVQAEVLAADLPADGTGAAQASGKFEFSISYFGAAGGEVGAKRMVEPGPAISRDGAGAVVLDGTGSPVLQDAPQRWIAAGAVVVNAKGETLRVHHPYFTPSAEYEDDAVLRALGEPARSYFDAAGRLIRRLGPDGTMESSEYGAWWERHADGNDTSDVSAWGLSRQILPAAHPDRRALEGALVHAGTPVEVVLDGFGRTVAREEDDGFGNVARTRTLHGAMGLPSATVDARGITATQFTYDMAERVVREVSADGGTKRTLFDAADNAVEVLLPSGAVETSAFDALDRLTRVDADHGGASRRIADFTYGDDPTDAATLAANLYGQLVETRDEAGRHRLVAATPGGVTLETETRLLSNPENPVDWAAGPALEAETFTTRVRLDALDRPVEERRADGAVLAPAYGLDGAMSALSVSTDDGRVPSTPILAKARYSVTGKRESAELGNGVTLERRYDPLSLRVTEIVSRRSAAGGRAPLLQDLRYSYDAVGNITNLADTAHDVAAGATSAFFAATGAVSAERRYTYDALYRLTGCEGRAHAALTGGHQRPDVVPLGDGTGLERFTQSYSYDSAGNLTRLRHTGVLSRFTNDFWVDTASNRSRPVKGPDGMPVANPAADFGAGGEFQRLDHLEGLEWRHDQRLSRAVVIDRSAAGQPDDDEIYIYDCQGIRVRKITRRMLAGGVVERREVIEIGDARFERLFRDGVKILDRRTSRLSDEFGEIAEMHRWSLDSSARETDDITAVRFRYTLTDHLGSATLRLDEAARIISYEEYLPFGARAFAAGDDARETALKTHGFIARERDAATGLHYISQRYYASWLCRWISPDPAGDVDGSNRYAYARNNPITYLDPTGLETTTASSRGREVHVRASTPARVEAAFAALPQAERTRLRGLMAEGNFNWFMGRDGIVHFGTNAEIAAIVERTLAAGENVGVVHNGGQTTTDPNATSGGTESGTEGGEDEEAAREEAAAEDATGQQTVPGQQGGEHEGGEEDDGGDAEESRRGTEGGEEAEDANDPPDEETLPPAAGDEEGPGRLAGSDKEGTGGGGESEDPNAYGRGDEGTGLGGGEGDPSETGMGRPGGRGTGTAGEGVPGGSPDGSPDGVEGGEAGGTGTTPGQSGTGDTPGGEGTEGDGETPGGGPGGAEGGQPSGIPNGSTNGSDRGEAAPEGTNPHSGDGGTRVAPGNEPPPQRAGGSPNGSAEGSANGNPQGRQGGERTNGAGGGEPATTMDHIVRVAGYWHLEFGSDEPGQSGGIPGGMGSLNLGVWGQAAFLGLTALDIVLTVMSFGSLAAMKASLKVGLKAIMSFGRRAMTRVAAVFTRDFARRMAFRGLQGMFRMRNFLFNRGRAFRAFVGDTGLWASRLAPGQRAIGDAILRDASNAITMPMQVLRELGQATRLRTRLAQYYRVLTSRASIELVPDQIIPAIARGKFGVGDNLIATEAVMRGLPLVTANTKMAAQIAGFPPLRQVFGRLRILGIGTDITSAADLLRLIP